MRKLIGLVLFLAGVAVGAVATGTAEAQFNRNPYAGRDIIEVRKAGAVCYIYKNSISCVR